MAPFDSITAFGFTAVPASTSALFNSDTYPAPSSPAPFIPVSETPVPNTALAKRVDAYVRANLPAPTYNHSLRVYHYGLAIKRYRFPSWNFTDETYFLSCLLHDIATTDENLHSTRLSFEFYGGVIALGLLQEPSAHADAVAPKEQAESVAEAVIRHQDLCNVGTITAVGQLLQLATIFDNTGMYDGLVHDSTIADVSKHYPRHKWCSCFVETIHKENRLKPWAHTTSLGEEDFPAKVMANKLMAPYE